MSLNIQVLYKCEQDFFSCELLLYLGTVSESISSESMQFYLDDDSWHCMKKFLALLGKLRSQISDVLEKRQDSFFCKIILVVAGIKENFY